MHHTDEAFKHFVKVLTVEDMISPGRHKQKLDALIDPPDPEIVKEFFAFLREHITLQSNGMGASLRENRADLARLMDQRGWDYPIYEGFIGLYEDALLQSHYDALEEKKK